MLTYLGNQMWYTDFVGEKPTGVNNQAVTVELPTKKVFYYSGTAWSESTGGGGEVNTASNLTGTAGAVGIFKQKSGLDLEFKKLNTVSNKVTITDDTANNEVDINVVESNLALVNMGGSLPYSKLVLTANIKDTDIEPAAAIAYSKLNLADKIGNADINTAAGIQYSKLLLDESASGIGDGGQIKNKDINNSAGITYGKLSLGDGIVNGDINSAAAIAYSKLNLALSVKDADVSTSAAIGWTKVSKTGSVLDDIGNVDIPTPANNDVLTWNAGTSTWISTAPPGASGGEANTVLNIGTAGVGVYKQKVGVQFELKKINAGSSKITVTDDMVNNEVDIDAASETVLTNQANIYGAVDQTFPHNRLKIGDSDGLQTYKIAGSNLSADATVTLPALTAATNNFVFDSFANIFTATQVIDKAAETSIAETFQQWFVSDVAHASGYMEIVNATASNAQFRPRINAKCSDVGAMRLVTYTTSTNDSSSSTPLISIDGARDGDASITTRPLFSVRNVAVARFTVNADGAIVLADPGNIQLGTTTGTKIGTATTQKLGFYNATPIVQGAGIADATDATNVIGACNAIISRLEALGLIATV